MTLTVCLNVERNSSDSDSQKFDTLKRIAFKPRLSVCSRNCSGATENRFAEQSINFAIKAAACDRRLATNCGYTAMLKTRKKREIHLKNETDLREDIYFKRTQLTVAYLACHEYVK